VQLKVAQRHSRVFFEGRKLRLVVRIVKRRPARLRGGEPAKALAYPGPGQVLDPAVIFMAPAVLAHLGHVEVADGAQPRRQIVHARTLSAGAGHLRPGAVNPGNPRPRLHHVGGTRAATAVAAGMKGEVADVAGWPLGRNYQVANAPRG
jgi:hypothetical protein